MNRLPDRSAGTETILTRHSIRTRAGPPEANSRRTILAVRPCPEETLISRQRRGHIDDQVGQLADSLTARPEFAELILRAVTEGGIDDQDSLIYAAAVTQALREPLTRLGHQWIDQAAASQARRHGLSARTLLGQLLGISRQSVDAAFGPAHSKAS